jgi:hypothetical protein
MMRAATMSTGRTLIYSGGLIACVLTAACRSPSVDQEARTASREAQPPFVGKTWMSSDSSAAPGTIRIFLPDGTLVMDSCGETYRLARWRTRNSSSCECTWPASSRRKTTAWLRCPSCVPTFGRARCDAFRSRRGQTGLSRASGRCHPRPWSASTSGTRHEPMRRRAP